jgi:hypothetical protein
MTCGTLTSIGDSSLTQKRPVIYEPSISMTLVIRSCFALFFHDELTTNELEVKINQTLLAF